MPQKKEPKGKIVRKLGVNVFGNPKYDRLLARKPHGPGMSPKSRKRKKSDYALHLLEKQKVRYCYGLSEKQFEIIFFNAKKKSGVTGENLIRMLESRLDNIIFRLGWAVSRDQARQMVNHKHFRVNGKPANIPSMQLNPGDVVTVSPKKNIQTMIRERILSPGTVKAPWLSTDNDKLQGVYNARPSVEAAQPPGDLRAIVEYYSR